MAETIETMPEKAFLKSLDTLESLAKGVAPADKDEKTPDPDDLDTRIAKGEADDAADDDLDAENEEDEEGEGIEKSFAESLVDESDNIQKAVEVSDFLADLVKKVGSAIDGLKTAASERFETIEKSLDAVIQSNKDVTLAVSDTLRKSFQAVSEKTDRQAEQLEKSLENLDKVLTTTPAAQVKSKLNVLEKSFSSGDDKPVLSRTAILKSLTDMFEEGNPAVTSMDILRFESNGALAPHIKKLLEARQ